MYFNSFSEFLQMGGYALYVWGSFGVTALVMAIEVLTLRRQQQNLITQLQDEFSSNGADHSCP
jgi:heme exporter protein D